VKNAVKDGSFDDILDRNLGLFLDCKEIAGDQASCRSISLYVHRYTGTVHIVCLIMKYLTLPPPPLPSRMSVVYLLGEARYRYLDKKWKRNSLNKKEERKKIKDTTK
jgi:hypothetical protein